MPLDFVCVCVCTNLTYTEKIQDLCLLWETTQVNSSRCGDTSLYVARFAYYVMFAVLQMVCTLRSFKVCMKIWVVEHVIANPISVSFLSQKLLCMKNKSIIFMTLYFPGIIWVTVVFLNLIHDQEWCDCFVKRISHDSNLMLLMIYSPCS